VSENFDDERLNYKQARMLACTMFKMGFEGKGFNPCACDGPDIVAYGTSVFESTWLPGETTGGGCGMSITGTAW
jgi:hypothetical protein